MKLKESDWRSIAKYLLITISICILGVLIGEFMMINGAPIESIICMYVVNIVLSCALTPGYFYGIFAAVFSDVAYNFMVLEPTFSFSDPTAYGFLTFGLMLAISLIISFISSKVKEGEQLAMRREEANSVLYHVTRDLAGCTTTAETVRLTLLNISKAFKTDCRMLLFNRETGKPDKTFVLLEGGTIHDRQPTDPNRDFAEYQTRPVHGYFINSQQYEWPLYSTKGELLAALAIPYQKASSMVAVDLQTINTITEAAAIVLNKMVITRKQEQARLEADQERYRTNLLRSISHDLRTPLAGISGTAEVLMSMMNPDSEEYRLAASIHDETNWLTSMVQNILSLTKLQSGSVQIRKEVMIVEDVVRSAVDKSRFRLPRRVLLETYPEDILAAPMDASLITQVIINLIDNANKYSPVSEPIEIVVDRDEQKHRIGIHVKDHGSGLTQAAMEKIFKMFYTTKSKNPEAARGFGLGLPICDMIMKVHDGSIEAGNRTDAEHGAEFSIYLPEFVPSMDMN